VCSIYLGAVTLDQSASFFPSHPSMEAAIAKAQEAVVTGNYPLGSIVEKDGVVIAAAFTELHTTCDPTAHAEVLAIRRAANALGSKNLSGCVLYTTLEPCPMCTSAAIWARMDAIVFGATQLDGIEKAQRSNESNFSWRQIEMRCSEIAERATPGIEVHEGFLREQCVALLDLTN
jgi:tRNA(adenine34) deaminase